MPSPRSKHMGKAQQPHRHMPQTRLVRSQRVSKVTEVRTDLMHTASAHSSHSHKYAIASFPPAQRLQRLRLTTNSVRPSWWRIQIKVMVADLTLVGAGDGFNSGSGFNATPVRVVDIEGFKQTCSKGSDHLYQSKAYARCQARYSKQTKQALLT